MQGFALKQCGKATVQTDTSGEGGREGKIVVLGHELGSAKNQANISSANCHVESN